MSQAIKTIDTPLGSATGKVPGLDGGVSLASYLPSLLPLIGAALLVTARIKLGAGAVPNDGTMIVLALLCYIISAGALMTNFWAPINFLQRLGI